MKKTLTVVFVTGILMTLMAGCSQTARKQAAADPFVEELLGKMTLEEKVGQMTQITLEVISKRKDDRNVQLDAAKLRDAIVKYHVGSILNCGGSANTFENWQ
jgi:beta-glucosidase